MENKPKTYEECYATIDLVVSKFQKKWQLKAINWFDFEDVSQIVKLHIFNKWHLWDQTRPLEPWAARVTSHQIRNIIRNNFTKNGVQNTSCDLFAKWCKQKKSGYGIKLPLPIENHTKEIDQHQDTSINFDDSIKKLNSLLKESLSDSHYEVYKMMFFQDKTEEEVAQFMGYKSNEKNRAAGYKQIKNLKKMLRAKAQEIISEHDILL